MMNTLKKIESKILTKLFMRWLNDEWDVGMLQMTGTLISTRAEKIQGMIDIASRIEVTGFRNQK